MWTMRRACIAACVVLLAACGDSKSSTEPPDETTVSGTFTLTTINNQPLPFELPQADVDKVEVTSGVIVVTESRTFTDDTDFRVTVGGEATTVTESAAGTYVLNGNTITFNVTGGGSYSLQLSAGRDRMTQVIESFTLIYQRN